MTPQTVTRRAVPDTRLAEINHIAATTGNDPVLDSVLLRLHTADHVRCASPVHEP